MNAQRDIAYRPLGTLKPVADDVWIADGPVIRFGMPWPKMPFPTRMTVIRLKDGSLFVHSPTKPDEGLLEEVRALGRVRWLIGPNRIHYWWIPDWRAVFPEAQVWLAPRIREQAGDRIEFSARELAADGGYEWDGEIATLGVHGSFMSEYVFFHRASRTLVLTDLVENFEPSRLGPVMRIVARLGGVLAPHGQMPRDMRLTYRDRDGLRDAVRTMLAWHPQRVVLSHGAWFDGNGTARLRQAFSWLSGL